MKSGLIKQLTLSASCAVLLSGMAMQMARAQGAPPPPPLAAAAGTPGAQDNAENAPQPTGSSVPAPAEPAHEENVPGTGGGAAGDDLSANAPADTGSNQLGTASTNAGTAPPSDLGNTLPTGGDTNVSTLGPTGVAANPNDQAPGGNGPNVIQVASRPQTKWSTMTLAQAVGVGVSTYPEHDIVANNRRATDEELRQARALYLPSIDTRVDGGYEHSKNPTLETLSSDGTENLWRYNTGITLTQMLFDGGAAKYENLRQAARVLSISHRVREAAELQGLAVVESYLEVMRQRELLKIARENVAEHMSIGDQIKDSTANGKTTQADEQQAGARLNAARAEEENTRESLRTAEADFIRDVGQEPEDLVMPATPSDHLEKDVEQEVKVTQAQSPTLAIYQADYKVAHEEYESTAAPLYPKFDFQLQGQDGYNVGGLPGRNEDASALVVMNWNLYRGGGDMAKRREYINREAQAKAERMKASRGIEDDVRKTWASMVSSGERAGQFTNQAGANVEVVKAYKDQFDLNRRTLLDVLDSQNELFVSRANAVNAQYLEMFAVYRLLALKGELLSTLNVPVPREADPAKM